MLSIFLPFFVFNEETLVHLNTNILETNIINIILLIAFLVYASNITFKSILEKRKNDIILMLTSAEDDVTIALEYYSNTEKNLKKTLFLLETWRTIYKQQKIKNLEVSYNLLKTGFIETFQTTESLLQNFEVKASFALQQSILIIVTSEIVRKFLYLSKKEQSKYLELTLLNLGELNK